MKNENIDMVSLGAIIVAICIVIGIAFAIWETTKVDSNSNYNTNNYDNIITNAREKVIEVLLKENYEPYEDTYMQPYVSNEYGLFNKGVKNFNINEKTFSSRFEIYENKLLVYERNSSYTWSRKFSMEDFSEYTYVNGVKTLKNSARAVISNGNFSCSGSTNDCNDLKVSMEKHKNEFYEILSKANVNENDLY